MSWATAIRTCSDRANQRASNSRESAPRSLSVGLLVDSP